MKNFIRFNLAISIIFLNWSAYGGDILYKRSIKPFPTFITVDTSVANHSLGMIFDTGASQTVVERGGGSDIIVSEEKELTVDATGSVTELFKAKCQTMKLGDYAINENLLIAPTFKMFRLLTGEKIVGFLGIDSFQSSIIEINYDKGIFCISNTLPRLDDYEIAPIYKNKGCPEIIWEIGGEKVKCLIDTGFNHTFNLNKIVFKSLVEAGVILAEDTANGGVAVNKSLADDRNVLSGWFAKGEFMGKPLQGVKVATTNNGGSSMGLLWLIRFNSIIDMKNSKFYFQKRNTGSPVNLVGTLGAVFVFENNEMKVAQLKPGTPGPVELAGLKVGDIIKTFNGVSGAKMNLLKIEEILAGAPAKIDCSFFSQEAGNIQNVVIEVERVKSVDE